MTNFPAVGCGGYEIFLEKFGVWSSFLKVLVNFGSFGFCGVIPPKLGGKNEIGITIQSVFFAHPVRWLLLV